ncbi:MAG: UBP-type zinc finger domain-containing protein [Ignavibacteria bacterium]
MNACSHISLINENVKPLTPEGCEECLKTGDSWVHLRICLICGHIGCCDQSKNKHATKHFHKTAHPVIRSFEPGEDWMWCYIDEIFIE